MSSVLPTDKVLVQRAASLHSAPADMSTVHDTDLLLINRAGVDYKCSFADWKASQASINKPSITTPAAGAVDLGETPTFTSSAFSGTGTTHASSDWQVTLKTDTAFASPVVQSMADTAHLLSWDGGPLQPNTDYIARVRHNGGSLQSPWSDAVGFKTKAAFIPTATPGHLYKFTGPTTPPTAITVPVLVQNVAASYQDPPSTYFAVGIDGKLYSGNANTNTMALADPKYSDGSPIADFWIGYNGDQCWVTLYADGSISTGYGQTHVKPGGAPVKSLMKIGGVTRMVLIEGGDGKLYVVGAATQRVGNYTLPNTQIHEIVFGTVGGAKMTKIAGVWGSYDAKSILLLGSDKKLYYVGDSKDVAFPAGGTNAAPVKLTGAPNLKDWHDISTLGTTYSTEWSVTGLTTDGELWAAGGGGGPACSTGATPVTFGRVATDCVSCGVGAYSTGKWYVLKKDGFAWGADASVTLTKCNLGVTPRAWGSLGALPGALNITGFDPLIIIPT